MMISEQTTITIGLLLALLGGMGYTVWWASRITSKLDEMIRVLKGVRNNAQAVESRVREVEDDVLVLKQREAL